MNNYLASGSECTFSVHPHELYINAVFVILHLTYQFFCTSLSLSLSLCLSLSLSLSVSLSLSLSLRVVWEVDLLSLLLPVFELYLQCC